MQSICHTALGVVAVRCESPICLSDAFTAWEDSGVGPRALSLFSAPSGAGQAVRP